MCLPRRWGDVCPGWYTPLVDRMTDTCENITFPQLLFRTVIIYIAWCTNHSLFLINVNLHNWFLAELARGILRTIRGL